MNKYLLYFGVVLFLIIFKLVWDWYAKNKKKRIIDHFQSALIDGTIYFTLSWILFHNIKIIIGLFLISDGLRWLIFDPLLSKINWGVWDFHGKSAMLDRFLTALDKGLHYKIFGLEIYTELGKWHPIVKLIPIIIGIIILIL